MAASKKKPAIHPLVAALNPDPAEPPRQAVKLFGLPGDSPDADDTRLWLDVGLTSYVDVATDAILYSKTLPDDAGTILWVETGTQLSYGSVTSFTAQADFLAGSITATHLSGAIAGVGTEGGLDPRLVSLGGQLCVAVTAHHPCALPSHANCPSISTPCPTGPGLCQSMQLPCRTPGIPCI
jgi:hypothetical protein